MNNTFNSYSSSAASVCFSEKEEDGEEDCMPMLSLTCLLSSEEKEEEPTSPLEKEKENGRNLGGGRAGVPVRSPSVLPYQTLTHAQIPTAYSGSTGGHGMRLGRACACLLLLLWREA